MKFVKGAWYRFNEEMNQPKFLIRVNDPEKMICSGWNCKGEAFANQWVFLGSRLSPLSLNAKEKLRLSVKLTQELDAERQDSIEV